MQVPAFLLRRLYVKGSLRNENGGFAFDLKNLLGSGYAEALLPLSVDGVQVPIADASFVTGGDTMRFSDVSAEKPMTLGMSKRVTIKVDGQTLDAGKHKLGIGFMVAGMGKMEFDVTDAIEADA
jgi:hydroxymethylglutaryl-CoA reductase (NADPH)